MQIPETKSIDPNKSWELVWNELAHAGIKPGAKGPCEGSFAWGQNAERAIRSLQAAGLPAMVVSQIGLLVQAAIRATELTHDAHLARKQVATSIEE
ncbi:MAG: hypothetical protein KatS3mg105_4080 [Gemmatales bacterium]|nr:MAG: hypothetical protein KatS3mg105_4080 [Gemmatales bacterium]